MTPFIRPRARDDIIRQFRWYLVSQAAPEAAVRFMNAVEESVRQVCRMPHSGAPRKVRSPSLKGLRVWPVQGFEEILIFYVVQGDTVRVIRVLHGKRDVVRVLLRETPDADTLC